MKKRLITDFKEKKELFDSFREKLVSLIKDLLINTNVNLHQIDSRTKSYDSLLNKIIKKDKYNELSEITDIVGIRVITYLESDVDKVDTLIRKEFSIDEENSIDKRQLQTNEFGYRSLHLVGFINESRLKLTEYKKYKGLKFEIQIRSILQHAWAEIEHDLGYKGKASLPESSVRSFNRMAALLESADFEFDRLKKELTKYENEVSALIKKSPESVTINQASLDSLVKSDKIFELVREYVRTDCDANFDITSNYSDLIEKLELFNIKNIKELQSLIENNNKEFIAFVRTFIHKGITKNLAYNLPLYWFQHYLAAKTEDPKFIYNYLHYKGKNISGKPRDLIKKYKSIKNHS